jgi:5-methylcytosine-specific restriction endonuclease McrA
MDSNKEDISEFPNFRNRKQPPVKYRKSKRGLGARPLLESEIRDIQTKARSAAEAARLLGVAYNTYKKYAKLYNIFDELKNPYGVGIRKGAPDRGGHHALDDILDGKYPEYPAWKLKRRLLLSGYMEEKCNNCGFEERRVVDYRVPLVLDFLDENKKNFKYDNLRMLCFNCAFLIRGNLTGPKKLYQY